jgi:hypothetical protein
MMKYETEIESNTLNIIGELQCLTIQHVCFSYAKNNSKLFGLPTNFSMRQENRHYETENCAQIKMCVFVSVADRTTHRLLLLFLYFDVVKQDNLT